MRDEYELIFIIIFSVIFIFTCVLKDRKDDEK